MTVTKDSKPFKVVLTPDVIGVLNQQVQDLQAERNNYQIGVGTVVAEISRALAHNPKLLGTVMQVVRKMYEENELKNA